MTVQGKMMQNGDDDTMILGTEEPGGWLLML